MDVTLYAMVIRELLRELHLSTAQAGMLASITLIASAGGGILFGLLADRFGRRAALIISILVYSVFTAACGFSHGLWELAVLRLGVGLGMGGEWATGAALVSETWPDQHRGKALGLVQSGFAIGYALAALIAALIIPRWGWRPVFFAGILPAIITLWIGRRVEESPLWLEVHGVRDSGFGIRGAKAGILKLGYGTRDDTESCIRNQEVETRNEAERDIRNPGFKTRDDAKCDIRNPESGIRNAVSEIQSSGARVDDQESSRANRKPQTPRPEPRSPKPEPRFLRTYAKVILVTLFMNAAALFGWWGLFTWIPSYLALPIARGGRDLSLADSSTWIIAMQAGMWLGYVTFGFISDAAGRKRTYVFYLLVAALLVPLYARANPLALLAVGPLLAFFGTGHFTGFAIITAELFPTSFRATAMGLTYNFGRALSAAAPWAIGALAARGGLASAFEISGVAFLLAAVLALALPETRGRKLE